MMRKIFITLGLILELVSYSYATPSNSMSVSPVAVNGQVDDASDENARNNEVSTKFNAHDHNDIDQTGNTLSVGDAAAGNKQISANNADTNKPYLRFDDTSNYWVFSDDGVAPSCVIHGNAVIFEGTTDNAFETTLSVTDPTADRTQTLQNNGGILPLGTAGNTLFFTTTGATNVTLPTSGTLGTQANFEASQSAEISAFTTTSTSFTDVTSLSVSLTLDVTSHILIILNANVYSNTAAGDDPQIIIARGGTQKGSMGESNEVSQRSNVCVVAVETSLAAGTYTWQARMKVAANTGNLDEGRITAIAIPAT